ncbi:sialidase family protein [Larkinella rosea]|uniref:Exo-alpha-sialidase n=1 Tax=Larkinella rosea TaxID=2025312 RepID=A0A3P1C3W7_9BACT|nr:sialidase family protein [Larkinella rosea]RRB07474.1 exo-alpha-sialidase [Larkinella rosea]
MTIRFLPKHLTATLRNSRFVGISVYCLGVFWGIESYAQRPDESSFGMRLRGVPQRAADVFEPVFVTAAPTNEATLIRTKNGGLTIFYVNRPGEADKLLSISSPDGLHWSEPVKELDLPGQAYYANRVLEDRNGGLNCIFHLWSTGDNGYRGKHLDVWYCRKTAAEKPWSSPRKIYDGYVGSMRSFIQLTTGELLISFARAVPQRLEKPADGQKDYGWNDILVLLSDDNGQNWKPSADQLQVEIDGSMPVRYGGIEPNVLELADGRLWMLIRTNKGQLYESFSTDRGRSWQSAQPSRFISSDSPAELLRLSDNRIVLFYNGNQRWDNPRSYAAGGREVLHAAVSRDEGKTWKGFREVLTTPSAQQKATSDRGTAYASAAETIAGKVAFVAGQGEAKAMVLFDPDWLEQAEVRDDFSAGLVQWTLYDADSLIRLTPDPKTGQNALLVTAGSGKTNAAALWNFPATAQGTLKVELELPLDSPVVSLMLTDHFSVSTDSKAADHAVVGFVFKPANRPGKPPKNRRTVLEIRWNSAENKANLYVNGRLAAQSDFHRRPGCGLNYLRIGLAEHSVPPATFMIRSVALSAQKNNN